jgi:hypothetical protein
MINKNSHLKNMEKQLTPELIQKILLAAEEKIIEPLTDSLGSAGFFRFYK